MKRFPTTNNSYFLDNGPIGNTINGGGLMSGIIAVIVVLLLTWLTVRNKWLYDPTDPNRPKKTKTAGLFQRQKKK